MMNEQQVEAIVAAAVAQALSQALPAMVAAGPTREEHEALRQEVNENRIEAKLAQLGGVGRLATNGGNLVLDYGGDAAPGGFEVRGEIKALRVIVARQYDIAGGLVAAGSESGDDGLAATWDYARAETGEAD